MVVADAAPGVGLGHLSRSGAIAAALVRQGILVRCLGLAASSTMKRDGLSWEPLRSLEELPPAPVAVLDSYLAPRDAIARLAGSRQLVLMHDGGPSPPESAVVVDAVEDACLRPVYWDLGERTQRRNVERILVTTGAGDPGGAGWELAQHARTAVSGASVSLVRGPQAQATAPPGVETIVAPDTLVDELLAADVVVSGAGQTMLEACATGTPCVAVVLADDQQEQAERLSALEAVLLVGRTEVPDALRRLADTDFRSQLAARARNAVDGRGALRVARRIAGMARR